MACRLLGAKPLFKPVLGYCLGNPRIKLQGNFNQNTKLVIHKNQFQNVVCEMTSILSRGDDCKMICEGNASVPGGSPSQRPVTRIFDVFIDKRLKKRLSKQARCRWFETPWCSLWRNCNATNWSLERSFDVFIDKRLKKRLRKQTKCQWFETPWRSLERFCYT